MVSSFVFSCTMLGNDPLGTNSICIWSTGNGAPPVVRVPTDCAADAKCIGVWTLAFLCCAVGFCAPDAVWGRPEDTHSVKEPRSQRERYMRAAPIDRIATTVEAGEYASVREGDSESITFISYLLAQ